RTRPGLDGRPVDDRAAGRLRRRRQHRGGTPRGRRLAAPRAEVLLLQRGRRDGPRPGPAGGRRRRDGRAWPLPDPAPAARRQPQPRQRLVEVGVDAEACLLLTMRLAGLLGRVEQKGASDQELNVFRLGTSLTKLYTAKRAVAAASEVIEAFGGQGYMEDTGLP